MPGQESKLPNIRGKTKGSTIAFPTFIDAKVSKVHVTNQSTAPSPNMASALKNRTMSNMGSASQLEGEMYGEG